MRHTQVTRSNIAAVEFPLESKIFINGRFLSHPMTGVQRYGLEITLALGRMIPGPGAIVLLSPKNVARRTDLRNIEHRVVGNLLGHAWEQTELAWYSRGGVLLSLCGCGPALHRRHVVVIHDAAVYANLENFSYVFGCGHRLLESRLARSCKAVVTVSKFSRSELLTYLPSVSGKIYVVPNGADHMERVAPDTALLQRIGLTARTYVFALGNTSPNKNLRLVTGALKSLNLPGLQVAVAGGVSDRVFRVPHLEENPAVRRLGYLTDAEIRALYEGALCFVFPSLYEGFGIPPLEAMMCGCPVIASDIPALRETCGDAALYCDPHDPRDLAKQIKAIAEQPDLRSELCRRGLIRAAAFTWARSAELLMQVVRDIGLSDPSGL